MKIKVSNNVGTKAPIITHAFAVDKGHYGYIWKIYIEAEDSDGDMDKIAIVVDQPGFGYYPTDWIILKPRYREHLIGYLQWNTFSSKASKLPEWTQLTLRVSVFDRTGNESNEAIFPISFETGIKRTSISQIPPPFDQGSLPRLGYLNIDLVNPQIYPGS